MHSDLLSEWEITQGTFPKDCALFIFLLIRILFHVLMLSLSTCHESCYLLIMLTLAIRRELFYISDEDVFHDSSHITWLQIIFSVVFLYKSKNIIQPDIRSHTGVLILHSLCFFFFFLEILCVLTFWMDSIMILFLKNQLA